MNTQEFCESFQKYVREHGENLQGPYISTMKSLDLAGLIKRVIVADDDDCLGPGNTVILNGQWFLVASSHLIGGRMQCVELLHLPEGV